MISPGKRDIIIYDENENQVQLVSFSLLDVFILQRIVESLTVTAMFSFPCTQDNDIHIR